jgi:Transposase DDE domain/Transposase domain (DUF772)
VQLRRVVRPARGGNVTPSKKIRRRPVAVDSTGQLDLVALLGQGAGMAVAEAALPVASGPRRPIRFVQPDPRGILIGAARLDEHLKAAKIAWPFVIERILAGQDWAPFEARYNADGRPGYAPRLMVGLILGGIMGGTDSLRGLEEMARTNLGVMWVTGGICPDHSVIGRFVLMHSATLTESFFAGLTASVLKATGSGTSTLAVDGTVIAAASARVGTLRAEALAAARREAEEKALASAPTAVDAAALGQADQFAAAEAELALRIAARKAKGRDPKDLRIHPGEIEAVVQPQKDDTFAPSYKPLVLANAARVVVAGDVHATSETAVMPGLIDDAAVHGPIGTLLGDAGFNSAGTIETTDTHGIELLAPEGRTHAGEADTAKRSQKQFLKGQFVYDADSDTYRCPAGHPLGRQQTTREHTRYGGAPCSECPLKDKCTKGDAGRTIKRYPSDAAKEAMRAKLAVPEHRQRYNKRAGMVEPVFAHLKVVQGLRRFRRRGLAKVRLEFMLHLAAYNLSRAVALAGAMMVLMACVLAALSGARPLPQPTQIRRRWTPLWPGARVLTPAPMPHIATAQV